MIKRTIFCAAIGGAIVAVGAAALVRTAFTCDLPFIHH